MRIFSLKLDTLKRSWLGEKDEYEDDDSLVETNEEIKKKVLNWLIEENYSPKERTDNPNAYFNYEITITKKSFHVIQNVNSLDSIFVGANQVLTPSQLNMLRYNMDGNKRQEFFWDLRLTLLTNNELDNFQIKPNPPHDIREIFITSKRIFYDALTKDRLVSTINYIYKTEVLVIWMLEKYAGAASPRESQAS